MLQNLSGSVIAAGGQRANEEGAKGGAKIATMSGRGFEDGAQSDDDPIHAMKAVGNKRARLGLSDVPEESQGSSARKVVFCVGDLTQLKETEWAWEYAKASLVQGFQRLQHLVHNCTHERLEFFRRHFIASDNLNKIK